MAYPAIILDTGRKTLFVWLKSQTTPIEALAKWGILYLMNLVSYFKDTLAELKEVSWPSRQATVKLTLIVIAISIGVAAYVGSLDFLFTNLLTTIVK